MTKTIFRYTFMVGISVLLVCTVLFFGLQYRQTLEETEESLKNEAAYAEKGLALLGTEYLESLETENRITLIGQDGTVLFDSLEGTSLENQKESQEFIEALENGEGIHSRQSEDSEATIYYARLLSDGTVLRLGAPISAVRYSLQAVSPAMWILILVAMISGVLALRVANSIVKPINELDLDQPEANTYPELSPLVGRIKEQNLTIQMQMSELTQRQQEFAALTDNMAEGFILVDQGKRLLVANHTVQELVPELEVGKVIPEEILGQAKSVLESGLLGIAKSAKIERNERNWELMGSPVLVDGEVSGAVILLMDVTEREQRERLRQEFSANVSHELKTPLTSISGFAELMMDGAVPQDKMLEFSGDIYRESQRLIALVEDIIKLSKLDEEDHPMPFESVELLSMAREVTESLKPAADKRSIRMEVVGSPTRVEGVYQVLHEMIYNLCDNAIKYNREDGTVTVAVDKTVEGPFVRVADTGIGIPYADQARVFERFYRVDKSHSKEIGGTGLGLSIVKHGAQLHGATVDLVSEPGKGTEITIRFSNLPQPSAEGELS